MYKSGTAVGLERAKSLGDTRLFRFSHYYLRGGESSEFMLAGHCVSKNVIQSKYQLRVSASMAS